MVTPAIEKLVPQLDVAKYFAVPPNTPSVWEKIFATKDWARSVTSDQLTGFVRSGLDDWGPHFIQKALEAASGDDKKPYEVKVDRLLTVGKPGKVEMGQFLSREVKRVTKERKKADWDLQFSKQFDHPDYRQRANERLTTLGERLTTVEGLAKIWANQNASAEDSGKALSYLDLRQSELVGVISKVVSKLKPGEFSWDTGWEGALAAAQDYEACAGLKGQVLAKMDQDPIYKEQKSRERRYNDLRWDISHLFYNLGVAEENVPLEFQNEEVSPGVRQAKETDQPRDYSAEHVQQMERIDDALDVLDDIVDAAGMDFPTVQKVIGANLRVQSLLEGNTDLRAGVMGNIERTESEGKPVETHTLSFRFLKPDNIDSTLELTLIGAGFTRINLDSTQEEEGKVSSLKFTKTYTSS